MGSCEFWNYGDSILISGDPVTFKLIPQPPHGIRRDVENAHDQHGVLVHSVENTVLSVPPAPQPKPAVLVDLPGFGMFAEQCESR